MPLPRTPPRTIVTRAQTKKMGEMAKEEEQMKRVQSDSGHIGTRAAQGRATRSISRASFASLAAARQLEFEAAKSRAEIELKEAETEAAAQIALRKAKIEKELLEKKLAADLAMLDSASIRDSETSHERVQDWLESAAAPGSLPDRQLMDHAGMDTQCAMAELTKAIKDAVVSASSPNNNNQELLSRLATSKDLPLYAGDPLEWLQFKEAFESSTRLCKYNDTENLWRLRKCLRGEAKEATSSLLMSATAPKEVIETLELRFGRPEIIMQKITLQLRKLQPLPQSYHNEIVNFAIKIKNCVTATRMLQQLDYLRSPQLLAIITSKLPTLLITKWAEYAYHKEDIPKLELLSTFLYEEAQKVAAAGVSHIYYQSDTRIKPYTTHNIKYQHHHPVLACADASDSPNKCNFCRRYSHKLMECVKFKRALRKDRWRYVRLNKLCFKCLGARHEEHTTCTAENCDIDSCGGPHHRLLHWTRTGATRQEPTAPVNDAQCPERDRELVAHATAPQCSELSVPKTENKTINSQKIYLKIVPVTVFGPKQNINTYALLDDGATVSLISADIADKAGLHGESVTLRATSAWDSGELVCKTEILNFDISNSDGNKFKLRARKLKELNLPVQFTSDINFKNFECMPNVNYDCNTVVKPTLLIGQDNYDLIAPIVCKRYKTGGPFITQTLLGWCVHGALRQVPTRTRQRSDERLWRSGRGRTLRGLVPNSENVDANATPYSVTNDASTEHSPCLYTYSADTHNYNNDNLHELIRLSFSLDSIGICSKPRENVDELKAIQILNDSAKLINGQWTVGLPWKGDFSVMPDSYPTALKRLKSIERKMLSDSEFELRYRDRINHLLVNNYARKLSDAECTDLVSKRIWYLPHFGVDNPNKNKLRLVFDAAAKCNDFSLNDFLLQGPDLLNSLYGIMFRFREHPIGVIGDIKDMFLRIKIQSDDQHALRFLWKEKDSDIVNKYAMTSLIFGANCSPFVAQYINQTKNASRFQDQMPDAVHAIQNNQYMDDYIDSFSDKSVTSKIIKDISFIQKQGGFEMHGWLTNEPSVLSDIPKDTLNDKAIRFNIDNQPERTLGLLWFPSDDMLAFDLSFKRIVQDILLFKRIPTKRETLSIVMSIFDIHGYLAPFTVNGKILIRETWKKNIQWDDELDKDLYDLFKKWIGQAKEINNIRIPRWYFRGDTMNTSDSESVYELHIFCDASPSAYAAVAYWRKQTVDGCVRVAFIASKCKVTPTKSVSIPRLELQGAVLACKLAESIKREHRLRPTSIYYWTDSTTVLYWIKNQCRTYKVFIANRLGEIDEYSRTNQWHYVPTGSNVADLATKSSNYVLTSDSVWFSGPPFLHQQSSCWPQQPEIKNNISNEILEKVNTVIQSNKRCDLPVPDPSRFSSWLRLLRATATVLLSVEKFKNKSINGINADLMREAEILLLRYSQSQSFQTEINLLTCKQEIYRDSRLRTLTPIIDENNILRVGGRIENAQGVDQLTKQPIILDGKDYIARLIVKHYHVNASHSGNEMVVNEMRQKYWLLKLRPTIRSVARQCLICQFKRASPRPPRLGDLPECRLTQRQRPFTMCGVDLFGPIEVAVGRQRHHRYGVLFTCLTVRAVHLEVVSSLTTDSLIMALRRMAARRGWPHTVFSDNGTNLRGANTELKKAYQEVVSNQQSLISEALNKGVQWKFIPPGSPHMGGAWERLIRSVKTALRVVLKQRAPKEETLNTFLCEVESMINSRPLTHVSVDPRDPESLTPNHFLLGSSSNLPQLGVFDGSDEFLRKQWRFAQRLADLFWSRWLKEVLPTLVPRSKWYREGDQLKVGDVVVVVDSTSPRNVWPKGIIVKVYPGADGRVRVADVKTKTGVKKRPASRLALLFRNECRSHDTEGQNVNDS